MMFPHVVSFKRMRYTCGMRLYFKERLFSWFGSYEIFGENGEIVYTVKGKLDWGKCFKIFNAAGEELGMVRQKVLTWLPASEIYQNGEKIGSVKRGWSFIHPKYRIDYKGWLVEGNFTGWNYRIWDENGATVATVKKELWHLADHYIIDVEKPDDALTALMFVLAIDAEKDTVSSGGGS